MTAEDFRQAALSMPEAGEGAHMGHADFRVGGRIFATLGSPSAEWGMVKLRPEQQEVLVAAKPGMFRPVRGGWGQKGATNVRLDAVDAASLRGALWMAWRNTAPAKLATRAGETPP